MKNICTLLMGKALAQKQIDLVGKWLLYEAILSPKKVKQLSKTELNLLQERFQSMQNVSTSDTLKPTETVYTISLK